MSLQLASSDDVNFLSGDLKTKLFMLFLIWGGGLKINP